ncbi:hypothetical protein [Micromonospora sp. NPDC023956]
MSRRGDRLWDVAGALVALAFSLLLFLIVVGLGVITVAMIGELL